jgi:hypothetical protein
MEGPYDVFFFGPSLKVFDYSVQNPTVFLISFLEILLDFIRVRPFSHETVSDGIDLVVSFSGDLLRDILDVIIIPIFFLIDEGKCGFQCVQFASLHDGRQVMGPGDEPRVPLI